MRREPPLARIDFCVTTFKRPLAIERLILSIGEHYPEAAVYVGDQNESLDRGFYETLVSRSGLARPPEVHRLDFDCGLSAARNHLVTSTPSEYKLILDDDFVFTSQTQLDRLVQLLDAHPGAGVVGGALVAKNGQVRFAKVRHGDPFLDHRGTRYATVDFVSNFALMRRELFAHVQWDPALKVFEHRDFYRRVKETPYAVLFTPDVVIDHQPIESEADYAQYRLRFAYRDQAKRKHGLT